MSSLLRFSSNSSISAPTYALRRQKRAHAGGFIQPMYTGGPQHLPPTALQVKSLYKDVLESIPHVKALYGLELSIPMMERRIRLAFEMNKNLKDPQLIQFLLHEAREDLTCALGQVYTSPHYLRFRYFGTNPVQLVAGVDAWQDRELMLTRKKNRERARAIATGNSDFTALPGPITDEQGNVCGYSHPKGDLPAGESIHFARPPPYKDWGAYSLPDPWNPHNSPDGPPDPHLITNSATQYQVNLARTGPYVRHRIRKLIEHEKKTREMSEFEYLTYFKENEVHLLANNFELPEYEWAEAQVNRKIRRAAKENQVIFEPSRAAWIQKYKAQWKGYNYAPSIAYWKEVFSQWVPNYNKEVILAATSSSVSLEDSFSELLSTPAFLAAKQSSYFQKHKAGQVSNAPLSISQENFLETVIEGNPQTARKPYDHPAFEDKWYTDNGVDLLLILKEDKEAGLGVRNGKLPVLQSELESLKEEIGCAELTEQRFKGEWWNRGHIRILTALSKIHDIELLQALVKEVGVSSSSTLEEAKKAFENHKFDNFSFHSFSCLRYPDGDTRGVHAWRVSESGDEAEAEANLQEKFWEAFTTIFNYEQTVPEWRRGCSKAFLLNKPAEKGGWTLKEDKEGFWDQLVSF